jgi:hypothetical protein
MIVRLIFLRYASLKCSVSYLLDEGRNCKKYAKILFDLHREGAHYTQMSLTGKPKFGVTMALMVATGWRSRVSWMEGTKISSGT